MAQAVSGRLKARGLPFLQPRYASGREAVPPSSVVRLHLPSLRRSSSASSSRKRSHSGAKNAAEARCRSAGSGRRVTLVESSKDIG